MSGQWHELSIGGHPADVFEPAVKNPQGFVVLYLHGVHLNRLVDKVPFIEQFEKYGLTVVAPFTKRSWFKDNGQNRSRWIILTQLTTINM